MRSIVHNTKGTCATQISFDLDEGNIVRNVAFKGGCPGNLGLIAKLVDGWTAEQIVSTMGGNVCLKRGTSCADQLAEAVRKAVEDGDGP